MTLFLYYLVVIGGSLPVTLAIINGNCVVAHGSVFSVDDDQFIHTRTFGSKNVRVSIVELVDMDTLLPIPLHEIITVHDAIGSFISWLK